MTEEIQRTPNLPFPNSLSTPLAGFPFQDAPQVNTFPPFFHITIHPTTTSHVITSQVDTFLSPPLNPVDSFSLLIESLRSSVWRPERTAPAGLHVQKNVTSANEKMDGSGDLEWNEISYQGGSNVAEAIPELFTGTGLSLRRGEMGVWFLIMVGVFGIMIFL